LFLPRSWLVGLAGLVFASSVSAQSATPVFVRCYVGKGLEERLSPTAAEKGDWELTMAEAVARDLRPYWYGFCWDVMKSSQQLPPADACVLTLTYNMRADGKNCELQVAVIYANSTTLPLGAFALNHEGDSSPGVYAEWPSRVARGFVVNCLINKNRRDELLRFLKQNVPVGDVFVFPNLQPKLGENRSLLLLARDRYAQFAYSSFRLNCNDVDGQPFPVVRPVADDYEFDFAGTKLKVFVVTHVKRPDPAKNGKRIRAFLADAPEAGSSIPVF
jgi:hypothetical protein